jgi:hypothetical protein
VYLFPCSKPLLFANALGLSTLHIYYKKKWLLLWQNLQITEGNKQQSKEYSLKVFRKTKHQYIHLCLSPIFINCKTIGQVSKLHFKGKNRYVWLHLDVTTFIFPFDENVYHVTFVK